MKNSLHKQIWLQKGQGIEKTTPSCLSSVNSAFMCFCQPAELGKDSRQLLSSQTVRARGLRWGVTVRQGYRGLVILYSVKNVTKYLDQKCSAWESSWFLPAWKFLTVFWTLAHKFAKFLSLNSNVYKNNIVYKELRQDLSRKCTC